MKYLLIILTIIFISCQSPKKDHIFIFFKWNIHKSYYLNYNSSDTLYYISTYPFKEQTSYTILSFEEKEIIENILDSITFPRIDSFENNSIDDGETYAFYRKRNKVQQRLKIHGNIGPKQFWTFGKSLEAIMEKHKFTKTNKKININEINKMFYLPPPPIIKE